MLFLLPLLAACAPEEGACPDAGLDAGTAEATVDGEAWASPDATWLWQGASLMLSVERAGNWSMSIVLQKTTGGATLEDAVAAGTFPLEIALKSASGGFATVYPAEGDSFVTNEGDGGTLTLASFDDGVLTACFDFAAEGDDGTVTVADGAALATERPL